MSKNHITPPQANVLAGMRLGFKLRYHGGLNAKCVLYTTIPQTVTLQAIALERAGLIERCNHTGTGCEFKLTEKGLNP